MKNRILQVAIITGLSLIFASCRKGATTAEVTPDVPQVDPWEGYEKTADGTRVILPEPISLNIAVTPMGEVYQSLRSVGDFDGTYSPEERGRATVNSPKPEKPVEPDGPRYGTPEFYKWKYSEKYRAYQREKDQWEYWQSTTGGDDWIRDLHIPELKEKDYEVHGLVPYPEFGKFLQTENNIYDLTPYAKVTVTLYKLPTSGVLSFMVNSKAYHTFTNADDNLGPLTLENPFVFSENPCYGFEKAVIDKRLWIVPTEKGKFERSDLSGKHTLFYPFYFPMFARLTDVTPNATKDGIMGRESGSTEPVHDIESIFLERACAKVTVRCEYEFYPEGGTEKITPVDDHFFDKVYIGRYPIITSVIPNNWDVAKSHYEKLGKPANIPFYRKNSNDRVDKTNDNVFWGLARTTLTHFYMPENFPTDASQQSTILVYLTKFDPDTREVIEKCRRYKAFEIPFGTKGKNGLREIRRNHSYEILLRFKNTPKGPVPYIVSPWDDVEIETEL